MPHRPLLLVAVLGLLAACADDTLPPRPDLPDAGPADGPAPELLVPDAAPPDAAAPDLPAPVACGENAVLMKDCVARCPAPCECRDLLGAAAGTPLNHCAEPCSQPAACPGTQRCGFYPGNPQPVCLPESLQTPQSYPVGASVDCILDPNIGKQQCNQGTITQTQLVWLVGKVTGCVTASVLLETCAQGCTTSDAGTPTCIGGSSAADAGPVMTDAGTVACCPAGYVVPGCYMAGGAKVPPHGCRMICCKTCHTWKSLADSHGCKIWLPTQ